MGGNLVILTGLDSVSQSYVTGYGVNAGTGFESVPGGSAHGWVLIDKSRAKASPPSAP